MKLWLICQTIGKVSQVSARQLGRFVVAKVAVVGETFVEALELGSVSLPDWHPRASDGGALIRAFVIRRADGVILFDTGVGQGHPVIDEMYQPQVVPIIDALHGVGVDERDVVAIVNSHLHFDHCGQNSAFPKVPVYVQAAELAAAEQPRYTVPEWAHLEPGRSRVIDGDEQLAPGLTIISTPGHSPGHQSLLVEEPTGHRHLIAGQCCYTCAEFASGTMAPDNLHDETYRDIASASLERLRTLGADTVYFSHDRADFRLR